MDTEIRAFLEFADSVNQQIQGKAEDRTRIMNLHEVYYFEIVDRRCFAYIADSVWQVRLTLQDILDNFGKWNFVRIGKSMVVNLNYVKLLKPDLNARVKIILENGETVVLSRKYHSDFYKSLERLCERNNEVD